MVGAALCAWALDVGAATDGGAPADAGASSAEPDLSSAPQALEPITPKYTPDAMKAGVAGDVILVIALDDLGAVKDVAVESGLPFGLTESAMDAARSARFLPARDRKGQPMAVRVRYI